MKSLESAERGQVVNVLFITEKEKIEKILEYVVQGNTMQMSDRSFVKELESWIRFGYNEVVSRGDGLFSHSSGNPVTPPWLGLFVLDTALKRRDR